MRQQGLLFSFAPIENPNVNIEARQARHEKLKDQNCLTNIHSTALAGKNFIGSVFDKVQAWLHLNGDSPVVTRLTRRVISFSLAFFIVTSLMPLYQFSEGQNLQEEGLTYLELTNQSDAFALETIMTEDGFLLKPALNTTEGDRTTANEIFAYEVQPGDTISSIAQQFGITRETIIMENDLWDSNSVKTGMMINILPVDGISHLVKKGDTLSSVATKYKVDQDIIAKQNQLESGDTLVVGNALIIPGAKKAAPVQQYAPASGANYRYAGASTGRLIWPTLSTARLTQGFHAGHYALDIASRDRGPIFAAASGKVIVAAEGWNGGYGNYVIIDHGNGMQTLYGHNEKLYVSVGQTVEQGQTIAWMGNTGHVYGATGIHVHFEVRINGVKYNPMNFF